MFYVLAKTDGTLTGTVALSHQSVFRTAPALVRFKDQILILVNNNQLWRSDGTSSGTQQITTLPWEERNNETRVGVSLTPMIATASVVYFVVTFTYDVAGKLSYSAQELWQTDGTAAGTKRISRLCKIKDIATVNDKLIFSGFLYFETNRCIGDLYSYIVDTDPLGTLALTSLPPVSLYNVKQMPQTLFGYAQPNLWISDGTQLGTRRLMTMTDQTKVDEKTHVVLSGNHLFFAAGSGQSNPDPRDLWAVELARNPELDAPSTLGVRPGQSASLPLALINNSPTTVQTATLTLTLPLSFTVLVNPDNLPGKVAPTVQDNRLTWVLTNVKTFEQKSIVVHVSPLTQATVGMRYPALVEVEITSPISTTSSFSTSLNIDLLIANQIYVPLSFR